MTVERINATFARLKEANKTALVSYIMGFDPDYDGSLKIMKSLPASGVDIIELGMAFSDPMADGPAIQEAALRALEAGATIKGTLQLVTDFRKEDQDTPVILMGYYNPILHYGPDAFVADAVAAGADGVIIVDLTPEEEGEFIAYSEPAQLAHIKLTAPTTTLARAETVLKHASGFVYYISVAGITGSKAANVADVQAKLDELKTVSDLPFVVGFGIKTPGQAESFAKTAEGIVVGSAFVSKIKDAGHDVDNAVDQVSILAQSMSERL